MAGEKATETPEFHKTFVPELEFLNPNDEQFNPKTRKFLQDLREQGLAIGIGVHESQLDRLSEMANQGHIKDEFCVNDPGRFSDREHVLEWLQKGTGRAMVGIYAVKKPVEEGGGLDTQLLDNERLAGLAPDDMTIVAYGWFGAAPIKELRPEGIAVSTAYRVSQEGLEFARMIREAGGDLRMGLALGKAMIATMTEKFGINRRSIGLEAWHNNHGAIRLYRELGFKPIARRWGWRPIKGRAGGELVQFDFDEDIPTVFKPVIFRDGQLMIMDVREFMVLDKEDSTDADKITRFIV